VPECSAKLVPEGEKYEVRVKGPQVSPGYYNPPEGAADPFDEEGYFRLGDAAKLADWNEPRLGMVFDGRLVENFKLASGTFVTAGALRLSALSAIGGVATDAVVCGEGRDGVGLLLFPDPIQVRSLGGSGAARQAVAAGLAKLNAAARGAGGKVARALILDAPPEPLSGEITDKGYINQGLARARRPAEIERLFAEPPDLAVVVLTP
jgi:feruloyl-CoA synthase